MANQNHLDILAKGVEVWNAWRKDRAVRPDLDRANLIGASLREVDFSNATMYRTDLSGATLSHAVLRDCRLACVSFRRANLSHAILCGSDLHLADLSDARLLSADFTEAVISSAKLKATNFKQAVFGDTNLGNLDLSDATGLEQINHLGPSTLGLDTIYRSGGKIPESFLRGANVPENMITYMHFVF